MVDRVQMSHYLDGEILLAFQETGDPHATIERLAGAHAMRHRVARRVRRVLNELLSISQTPGEASPFPRLPEEYRGVLDALLARGAEWLQSRTADVTQG